MDYIRPTTFNEMLSNSYSSDITVGGIPFMVHAWMPRERDFWVGSLARVEPITIGVRCRTPTAAKKIPGSSYDHRSCDHYFPTRTIVAGATPLLMRSLVVR